MVEELKFLEQFASSGHNMIELEFLLQTTVCDTVVYNLYFNKGDCKAIKAAMKHRNWHEEFYNKNTLECYKVFTRKLFEVVNAHIPVKKLRTKNKCLLCNRNVKRPLRSEIENGSNIVLQNVTAIT